MKYGIKSIGSILLLTFASHIHAQTDADSITVTEEEHFQALVIGGMVVDNDNKPIKGALVELYEGNNVVSSFKTRRKGTYKFQLLNNYIYTLQFSCDGFITKRISVNTALPAEVDDTFAFTMDPTLLPASQHRLKGENLYEYPSTIVQYDERRNNFIQDERYSRKLMRDIRSSKIR